jgi:CHAT domain-containing protein/Flp pilus assembly protein TadD
MMFPKTVLLLFWVLAASSSRAQDLRGVVIETMTIGFTLDEAGIRPGDVVLSWEPESGTEPRESREISSPFDWFWLAAEQAPRGPVNLTILRAGQEQTIALKPGNWQAVVRPRLTGEEDNAHLRAQGLSWEGRSEISAALWKRLAGQALPGGRLATATWARVLESHAWAKAGDPARSRQAFQSALMTGFEAHDEGAQIQAWCDMAGYLWSINELTGALDAYGAADLIVLGLKREHQALHAWLLLKMAQLAWIKLDLQRADTLAQAALALYSQLAPDSLQMASALNIAAIILDDMGQPLAAEKLYRQSLSLAEALGNSGYQANALNNLGTLAYSRGEFIESSYYFERTLSILETTPTPSSELVSMYNNLATLSQARGDLDQADTYFRKGLEFLDATSDPLPKSRTQINRGLTALGRGDLKEAEALCGEGLKIREDLVPDGSLSGSPLNCLSLISLKQKDTDKALALEQRALSIVKWQAPGSLPHADHLIRISEIYSAKENFEDSEIYAEQARTIYERLAPNSDFHAAALHQLARIFGQTGRNAEALVYFDKAITVLESQITRGYESEVDRGSFRAWRGDLYLNFIEQIASAGNPERAFHALERWRAGSFLGMITEKDLMFSDIPPELNNERRRISQEYDQVLQRLSGAGSPEEIEELQAELVTWRVRHEEVNRRIRSASPRLDALRYPQPLDFYATQKSLDPGTLLLSFAPYPDHLLLFVVTAQGPLRMIRLETTMAEIRRDVEALLRLLPEARSARPAGRRQALNDLCHRLYHRLLAPAAAQIESASRLVIIPAGPLLGLPWGLLARADDDLPSRKLQYLAEWKPIHVALSATVYDEIRKTRPASRLVPGGVVAAFGDPIYPAPPGPAARASENVDQARLRELVRDGSSLEPLPGSRREIEGIETLFPTMTKTYLGADATEEQAKSLPRDTRIVHFAAHTKMDERSPLDSAVALTIPAVFAEGHENGLLQAWEIFESVRLDADLVVLSACESGLGKEMGGEGLIGLTRAFQYAGARSVMASLWKISDRTTAELMVRFYRYLKEGLPKDEALRAAQMELIRGPIQVTNDKGERVEVDASAPYYWAAFQIYGDWQ